MKKQTKVKKAITKPETKNFWNKRNTIIFTVIIIAGIVVYLRFFKKPSEPQFVKEGKVIFLNKDTKQQLAKIDVEVAIKPEEQMQGLMFRSKMDENDGMLFIYPGESKQAFWMANTLISLDIAFVEAKGKIDTIYRFAKPLDSTSLPSRRKIQFVVETNGGFSDRHGIKEGDLIEYKLLPTAK
ncbi:MAG TPA: DUF192 domain-containing protein [Ignavibacteria bacterium]